MDKSDDIAQQYIKAYDAYMNDPYNGELKETLEQLEAAEAATADYQTLKGLGDQQVAYLKALDFTDSLGPSMRLFNCCRTHTGSGWSGNRQGCCGLAFPAKMWCQPDHTAGSTHAGRCGNPW